MTTPTDRPFTATDDDRRMTDAERAEAADDRSGSDWKADDRTDADDSTGSDWSTGDATSDTADRADATSDTADRADATNDRADAVDDRTDAADELQDRGTPADAMAAEDAQTTADEPLVPQDAAVDFKTRWEVIQGSFVDDPRNAVTEADKLVDDVLKRLSESFEHQHQDLEKQWSDGEPETEDLRTALQKYRAFFQRLLAL
ncbi:hypothetical protein EV646_11619 [Kribbella antiqua]|uniref:Uncharacterized protein n=1 Tax=Kribbella antiqua TaxID=2512217 RepID=A0A4R2IBU8_9ACTN|nr:hypothetical protein [Kribbella antiqua]TCO40928.1 hypothetical protein EV646_11619 [Kribbella antiqua]